jgi:hypothetical protein
VERVSTSLRQCAPSGLHGARADTRTARSTACGRGRAEHHPVCAAGGCVCTQGAVCAAGGCVCSRGALRAAHGTSRAHRGRPGWCRTPACERCFLCSHPRAPPPAIAVANTSAAELNTLLHGTGSVPGSGVPAPVWRCGMRSEARSRVA